MLTTNVSTTITLCPSHGGPKQTQNSVTAARDNMQREVICQIWARDERFDITLAPRSVRCRDVTGGDPLSPGRPKLCDISRNGYILDPLPGRIPPCAGQV